MPARLTSRIPYGLRIFLILAMAWLGRNSCFSQQAPPAPVPASAAPSNAASTAQFKAAAEKIHNLSRVVQRIGFHVSSRELAPILSYDGVTMEAFLFLLQRPDLAIPGHSSELKIALRQFSANLNEVRNAARDGNPDRAAQKFEVLARGWSEVKALYQPTLLSSVARLSNRYSCPTHVEVSGQPGETCPKCGRTLQLVDEFCGQPSKEPVIKASVRALDSLSPGQRSVFTLQLSRGDGVPIRETDLLPTHTERIHLFAIDATLTDYHHAHPRPSTRPGDYEFSLVPRFGGGYRVWLDLLPAETRREEMPTFDIGSVSKLPITREISNVFTNGEWRLQFVIGSPPLKSDLPGWAKLVVTDLSGGPCVILEPILANFAHFVAFHEDLQTVFHLHAAGLQDILDPKLRGGPEVQVYLPGLQQGFVRLFAQVQINGQVQTASFGLYVQP